MKSLILLAVVAVGLVGCCGAQGVPKANLYWPITFGVDSVAPTQPQTVNVQMIPASTVQSVPAVQAVPYSAPFPAAAYPCR